MKKILITLLILSLGIIGVFAASETHNLTLTVDIATTVPAFRLRTSDAKAIDNNTTPTVFTNEANYTGSYDYTTTEWELGKAHTLEVEGLLVNNAKTNVSYTVTFSGGTFAVTRGSDTTNTAYAPTSITASAPTSSVTGINTISASGAVVTLPFNGATATASTGTPVVVAKAAYSYPEDKTIDPGNDYTTTITMTVSAN